MFFSIARTIAHDPGESEEQGQPLLHGRDRRDIAFNRSQVTEDFAIYMVHGGFKAAAAVLSPTVRMYLLPSRDRRSSDAALFRHPLGVGSPWRCGPRTSLALDWPTG
jgi:hypothetical protein